MQAGRIGYAAVAGAGAGALVDAGVAVVRHDGVLTAALAGGVPAATLGLWIAVVPALASLVLAVELGRRHSGVAWLKARWPGRTLLRPLGVAGLLAGAWIAGMFALVDSVLPALGDRFADPALIPPALGVLVAVVGFGGGLLALGVAPALARLAARAPIWVAGLALVGSLAGAGWVLRGPVRIYTGVGSWTPAGLLGVALVACVFVYLRLRPPRAWLLPLIVLGAGAAGLAVTGRSAGVRDALQDGDGVAHRVAEALRALGDRDGDGFARWLGGGDCDDADGAVHPAARDVPGNGRDEDCDGADRTAGAAVAGLAVHHPLPASLPRRPNLLLITVDALRPDHLGTYGYLRPTSPNIDALAARGAVFERAWSSQVTTAYAVPSLLTGRRWARLRIEGEGAHFMMAEGNNDLFERLSAAGYHTEVQLPRWLTDRMLYGLARGVKTFGSHAHLALKKPSSEQITDLGIGAISRLGGRKAPWALWLHYLDPHAPYKPKVRPFGDAPLDRYDGEIVATDAAIGRLIAALDRNDALADTLVVLTADHGEEFKEHGGRFHGKRLFEETARVPLIIAMPGASPRRSATLASVVDVPETVANLLGLPPGLRGEGRSLAASVLGADQPPVPITVELMPSPQRPQRRVIARIEWPYKIIHDLRSGRSRLYQLEQDPGEARDLARTAPTPTATLLAALKAQLADDVDAQHAWLRGRFVLPAAPKGAWTREPVGDTGLMWLGGEVKEIRQPGGRLSRVRHWLEVERQPVAALELELTYRRPDGGRINSRRYAPLWGVSPTTSWAVGEVIEDLRFERFHAVKGGPVSVEISVFRGDERVFGPRRLTRE